MFRRFLVMGIVAVFCGSAVAEQVTVNNYSFEDPVLEGAAATWTNDLPQWAGPPAAGDAFIEYIAGFTAEGVNHLGMAAGAEVSQDLGVSLLPNTTYNFTVAVGNRNLSFTPAEGNASTFGLYAGADALDGGTLISDMTVDAYLIPESTFEDFSLSVTTGADVPAGNIFVSLQSTGAGRAHFDNIRLAAVPEPSTAVLALLGLLGLAARTRRR